MAVDHRTNHARRFAADCSRSARPLGAQCDSHSLADAEGPGGGGLFFSFPRTVLEGLTCALCTFYIKQTNKHADVRPY